MRKKSGFTIVEQAIVLVPGLKVLSVNWNNRLPYAVKVKVH